MKYRSMIALLLAVLMLCSMAACSSEDEPKKTGNAQERATTTIQGGTTTEAIATEGVTGSATGSATGGATEGVNGSATGNATEGVTGSVTGSITGNVTGSVTGSATKETNTTAGSVMSTTDSNTAIMGSTIVLEVVTTEAKSTMKKPTTTKKTTTTTKKPTSATKATATSGKATTTAKNPSTTKTSTASGVQVGPLVLTIEDYHGKGYIYRDVSVDNPNYMLKLTAAEDLVSVRLMSFNADTSKPESELRRLRGLKKGESQYIYTYVNDAAPVRGIACTDTTGKNRYFVFCYSGRGDTAPVYLKEIRVGH